MRLLIILLFCCSFLQAISQSTSYNNSFSNHKKIVKALQNNEILSRNDLFGIYDYYSENNQDSLYFYSNMIIEIGIKYENWGYINCGKAFMVGFFNTQSRVDIATQLGRQSLEYFMNTADYEMISFIQNQIGISYTLSKEYDKAKSWFLKSIESGKQTGDFKENAVGLKNIAELHYRKGEYDSSLHYIKRFIKVIDNSKSQISTSKAYNQLGNIYREMGDNERAITFYKMSLTFIDNKESAIVRGNAYNNLAIMYFEKDPELAKTYFFKSLKARQKINLPPKIADSYLNLGHWYFTMEKLDSAMYYYNFMLEYCLKNKYDDGQIEAYSAIQNYYEILKDEQKVLLFSEKQKELSDKVIEEKKRALDEYIEKTNSLFTAEEELSEKAGHLASQLKLDAQMGKYRSIALIILLASSIIGLIYYVYNIKHK